MKPLLQELDSFGGWPIIERNKWNGRDIDITKILSMQVYKLIYIYIWLCMLSPNICNDNNMIDISFTVKE